MKVEWIEYKGKRILFSDYTGCNIEQMVQQLKTETDFILREKSEVLYLADFTGTTIAPEFMEKLNVAGKLTKKVVSKSAIVGITGMKAMLMNTFNMMTGIKAKAFDHQLKAKEYLIN